MATLSNKTIKTAAGDYASVVLWEAGEQVIASDLVSGDILRSGEMFDVDDAGGATIDGCTTDPTRYIRLYATTGIEATLPYSTSRAQFVAAGNLYTVADLYTRTERIGFDQQNSSGTRITLRLDSGGQGSRVIGCVAKVTGTSGSIAFDSQIQTATIAHAAFINLVVIGNKGGGDNSIGISVASNGGATTYAYNITSVKNLTNFLQSSGTAVAKNNIGNDKVVAGNDYSGTFTEDHCLSGDATAAGTGSLTSKACTFVNAGTGDYRLASGDTTGAIDGGTSLAADANYPFSTDFEGTARGASWDMGASEVAAAAATDAPDKMGMPRGFDRGYGRGFAN